MEMIKVNVLNASDVFEEVHLNAQMIAAVMGPSHRGLTRIIMSGGEILEVEDTVEHILARLRLV